MGIDELRLIRDRAKVKLEVALDMERDALRHFAQDPTRRDAWQHAKESAARAEVELQSAQTALQQALRNA